MDSLILTLLFFIFSIANYKIGYHLGRKDRKETALRSHIMFWYDENNEPRAYLIYFRRNDDRIKILIKRYLQEKSKPITNKEKIEILGKLISAVCFDNNKLDIEFDKEKI